MVNSGLRVEHKQWQLRSLEPKAERNMAVIQFLHFVLIQRLRIFLGSILQQSRGNRLRFQYRWKWGWAKVRDESRKRRREINLSIILPSAIICSIILNLQKIFVKLVKKDQTFLQIFWISFLLTFANAVMLFHYYCGVRHLSVPNFYEAALFSMVFAFITCLINCGRNT